MPIRWNALHVAEAMNMVEEYVNQAVEPLEQAKLVAKEAAHIDNLPLYVGQHFGSLKWDIERLQARFRTDIASVRKAIPDGAIETERAAERYGSRQRLPL